MTRFWPKSLVWLLGVVVAVQGVNGLVGCRVMAKAPLTLQPRRELKASDYNGVLSRWTRSDKVYDTLDSILFVWATFHSPEFRRAFLVRHPNVYGPGSEEASRLLLTRPDAELFHEFFVSVSTAVPSWNDLDRENSIWRVTLEGDGVQAVQGEVQKVKTTANLRVIYPHITDFARTYSVRFPLTTEAGEAVISGASKKFTMRVTSALGQAELVWKLEPARQQSSVATQSSPAGE